MLLGGFRPRWGRACREGTPRLPNPEGSTLSSSAAGNQSIERFSGGDSRAVRSVPLSEGCVAERLSRVVAEGVDSIVPGGAGIVDRSVAHHVKNHVCIDLKVVEAGRRRGRDADGPGRSVAAGFGGVGNEVAERRDRSKGDEGDE